MDKRTCYALTIVGVAVVAYSIGYNRALTRAFDEFGAVASREAMLYLAGKDAIQNRFGR